MRGVRVFRTYKHKKSAPIREPIFVVNSRFCLNFGADLDKRLFDAFVGLFREQTHDDEGDASEDERGEKLINLEHAAEF